MKVLLNLILCFIFLFCLCDLKGQADFRPGYVITYQNDTIRGFINFEIATKNGNKCDFKAAENSELKEYFPTDIKGFRFTDSKYFISKDVAVNGEKVALFLEFLIDGTADLYSFNNSNNPRFFIQISDGEITELLINKERIKNEEASITREKYDYMGTLKTLMADAPRFFPAIDKTAFETQSLIMLVKRYNDYVSSSKSVFYEKQPPDVKFTVGAFVTLNNSSLGFDNSAMYEAIDFQKTNYPSIGVLLNISLPRSNRTMSLQTSAEVGKSNFYGTGIHPLNSNLFEEVYFETVNLKGKLGVKYTYPSGTIRPTLLIGGNIIYLLNKEGRRVEDFTDQSTVYINEINENIMAKFQYGYDLELGFDLHLSSSVVPFLSIGYTYSTGNNKDAETRLVADENKPLTTIIKNININAGIYF